MAILTDESTALARLKALVAADKDPALTSSGEGAANEIQTLLDEFERASVWTANTVYVFGAVVIPITRNGRRYRAVTPGTSHATTEPSWPDSDMARVSDGTVTWEESGPEYDLWDLRGAAHKGWLLKAAKASERYDFSADNQSFNRDQLYKHCMDMANRYVPIGIA